MPPLCTPMASAKNQCEVAFCNDPEKLKACHCNANNASITIAKTICAANACPTDLDACELDYCMSGDAKVAARYKEMQVDVCEVECQKCEGTGGTCASCKLSPSCNPTCTHAAGARTTNAAGCESIQDKTECCSSYDGRPLWASKCVPGDWGSSVKTLRAKHALMLVAAETKMAPNGKTLRGLDALTSMLVAAEAKKADNKEVVCQSEKWIKLEAGRETSVTGCNAPIIP